MNGELEICPAAGYVVTVLANMDPPAAGRISQFITNRLPERRTDRLLGPDLETLSGQTGRLRCTTVSCPPLLERRSRRPSRSVLSLR